MTIKEIAIDTINTLPDSAKFDEIINALQLKDKFEKGKQKLIETGGITNQEAKVRMSKWLK